MNYPEFTPEPDLDVLDILERAPFDSYQARWLGSDSVAQRQQINGGGPR